MQKGPESISALSHKRNMGQANVKHSKEHFRTFYLTTDRVCLLFKIQEKKLKKKKNKKPVNNKVSQQNIILSENSRDFHLVKHFTDIQLPVHLNIM